MGVMVARAGNNNCFLVNLVRNAFELVTKDKAVSFRRQIKNTPSTYDNVNREARAWA